MTLRVLSLGAGVQSSTIALMSAKGELPPLDCAIFADTQAEPNVVYEWLDWLERQLPFPVHRVTAGSLRERVLRVRVSERTGKRVMRGGIPAYLKSPEGTKGILGRKCTLDFKIVPINRKLRELLGKKRFAEKDVGLVEQWVGISTDEAHRMKPSRYPWATMHWPLIEAGMNRGACLHWMRRNGYPEPPRSACTFCPFHSDAEWANLRDNDRDEWARVVGFDEELRRRAQQDETLRGVPYLHASLQPINEVDFDALLYDKRHQLNLFGNECEGLCGV